jgi:hypothetical protein
MTPDLRQVRRAGSHLVAAVYALEGHRVSWPLEPAFYDLLADPGDGTPILRVQVKTCTSRQGDAWMCWTGRTTYAPVLGGKRRVRYPPDALDVLAVVDGDLAVYLIPFALVAGQTTVTPRAYSQFRAGILSLAATPAQVGSPAGP